MRPLIIAHRGAPSYLPEHTESSYRLAVRQGADLVEPDVVPTRDGVLIVRHEARLESTTDIAAHPEFAGRRRGDAHEQDASGTDVGWFAEDFDWAEIRRLRAVERLPRLRPDSAAHSGKEPVLRLRELVTIIHDEALARNRHCGLVIELKHDARCLGYGMDYVELLARELDGLWHLDALRHLRIESFEAPVLDRLREHGLREHGLREHGPREHHLSEHGAAAKLILLVAAAHETAPGEEGPDRLTVAGLDDAAARFDGISVRTSLLGKDYPAAPDAPAGPARDREPGATAECAASAGQAQDGRRVPLTGRALVAAARARGLEVLTYTLRTEDAFLPPAFAGRPEAYWRTLIDTGVDGLFADAPDRLAGLLLNSAPLDRAPLPAAVDVGGPA